ncbi:putative thiol-disulfide oxidoreductase DCC [Paenibacillus curdlanolyticus YK9]|uniref:Putative thiol-disulfide oxidoreductase DCC n=1 Tax=Paenibacillus curdlanolyticus YK9 TaxID=717606 RepID=E0I656_9BACL|nr:DCC1-like thiol-disulfide oxidoreductase family protein [Paenibacillus curdlanolyticus]EFM12448.1 putative thiol-disulfide oxidoreductase DCC [Paenibacillus curdlanolyticus YK9]
MAIHARIPDHLSILLVDGECALCHGMTRFTVQRDKQAKFRFASLQSEAGQHLLIRAGLDPHAFDSMVLLEQGRVYLRSSAALRVLRGLDGGWPLLFGLIIIPAPIRDFVYRRIAKWRYRLFGRADACLLPSIAGQSRFVDDIESLHKLEPQS